MTTPALSPARARELAAATDNLAQQLEQAHAALRADVDEHRRRAGFRLEEAAAGQCRRVADELQATGSDLARLAAIRDDACRVPWRVCPEHGNTLTSSGGQSWCSRCDRRWPYSLDEPCPEPVTHTVTDAAGSSYGVCIGHAVAARAQLAGGTVTPQKPRSDR